MGQKSEKVKVLMTGSVKVNVERFVMMDIKDYEDYLKLLDDEYFPDIEGKALELAEKYDFCANIMDDYVDSDYPEDVEINEVA